LEAAVAVFEAVVVKAVVFEAVAVEAVAVEGADLGFGANHPSFADGGAQMAPGLR